MKLQLSRSSFVVLLICFNPITVNGQKNLEVTQPEMVQAEAGESVNISCSFMSQSRFYTVTWTLGCNNTVKLQDLPCFQHRVKRISDDDVQTPQSPKSSSNETKTTLTIINVTENDSGRFCCEIKTTDGEKGTGAGTRLEVTRRSCPTPEGGDNPWTTVKISILYAVIGAEACVIIILIIVVIIGHRSRGLSRSEDQGLQLDSSGLQYAEICKKSFPQNSRPSRNMEAVVYSAVKTRSGHVTNQEYDS